MGWTVSMSGPPCFSDLRTTTSIQAPEGAEGQGDQPPGTDIGVGELAWSTWAAVDGAVPAVVDPLVQAPRVEALRGTGRTE